MNWLCDWFGWCAAAHSAANSGHGTPEIDGMTLGRAVILVIGVMLVTGVRRAR